MKGTDGDNDYDNDGSVSELYSSRSVCENLPAVQWTTHRQKEDTCKEKDTQPGFQ